MKTKVKKQKLISLALLIQKEVTIAERNQFIKQLEKDGWCVNVESEEEDFL